MYIHQISPIHKFPGPEDADGAVTDRALEDVEEVGELAHAKANDVDAEARFLGHLVLDGHLGLPISEAEGLGHGLSCILDVIGGVADEFAGILDSVDDAFADVLAHTGDGVPVLTDRDPHAGGLADSSGRWRKEAPDAEHGLSALNAPPLMSPPAKL